MSIQYLGIEEELKKINDTMDQLLRLCLEMGKK